MVKVNISVKQHIHPESVQKCQAVGVDKEVIFSMFDIQEVVGMECKSLCNKWVHRLSTHYHSMGRVTHLGHGWC